VVEYLGSCVDSLDGAPPGRFVSVCRNWLALKWHTSDLSTVTAVFSSHLLTCFLAMIWDGW
jgi:hypothetical protein